MAVNTFIKKLLKLSFLKVSWYEFRARNRELHLGVKPYRNGCRCPHCGRRGNIVRLLNERTWRDVVVCGIKVFFHYRSKEIMCRIHGRVVEDVPWAAPHARVTYRLELSILVLGQRMTQKAAARLVKLPTSTFSDVIHRVIRRERHGHKIRGLKTLGVDEISYAKGKKYVTLIYDLDRCSVLWAGKGKGKETIDTFFKTQLSEHQRKQISWACCDLSRAYVSSIKEHCPNVTLVLDKFHIVQALNRAVDEVRKESWRDASKEDKKVFRGIRWLIAFSRDTRTKRQTRKLNLMEKFNRRIYRAWLLKDNFEHFWDYISPGHARKFIETWITRTLRSRLQPLKEFALMLRRNLDNILSFIENPITNAKAEGINRMLKILKNRSSGFKTLDGFIDMIYLNNGDVDIPAQFPKTFCTL